VPEQRRSGGGDAISPGAGGEAGLGVVEVGADDLLAEVGSGRPSASPAGGTVASGAPGAGSDVLPRRPRRPADSARTVEPERVPSPDRAPEPGRAAEPAWALHADRALSTHQGPESERALATGTPPSAVVPPPPAAIGQPSAGVEPPPAPLPRGGDHAPAYDIPAGSPAGPAAWGTTAPVVPTRRQRQAARRLQARKVGRLVRHIDLWSVFKLALLFHLSAFLITLVAGSLLWAVAIGTGVVRDLEGFIREAFALESFTFDGGRIFRAAALGGLALVVAATAVTVMLGALLNLISDVIGGVRFTVVEEETAQPRPTPPTPAPRRRRRL
jgi:hypothetical protein